MIQWLCAGLVIVDTLVFGVLVVVVSFLDPSGRAWLALARVWNRIVMAIYDIRFEVRGEDKIPRGQPLVVMSNHQSMLDIPVMFATVPFHFRFVSKKEIVRIPVFGWAVWASGQIMIDRKKRARAVVSLRKAAERVRAGASVVIFPEGTRSRDGTLRSFKSGGIHLAIDAQVPILPMTISGSHHVSEKGSTRIRRGSTIVVTFGTPIPTAGLDASGSSTLKKRVREAILAGYDPVFQSGEGTGSRPKPAVRAS